MGASDAAGTRVEKGNKKGPKRPKMPRYRDKVGVESSFIKIIKSTVYCEELKDIVLLRNPTAQ